MNRDILILALITTLFLLAPKVSEADRRASFARHCQAVYAEVWELHAKNDDFTANGLRAKMRRDGCFDKPAVDSLCAVLDAQEARVQAENNYRQVSVIRAQKKKLGCGI